MKMRNVHERVFAAPSGDVTALVHDFDRIWPSEITRTPTPQDDGLYKAGIMLWQEYDRPGAARAFRVVSPEGVEAEHWFEVEPVEGGTRLRHTIDGEAVGDFEAIWRDRIEPAHNLVLEKLLDNVGEVVG